MRIQGSRNFQFFNDSVQRDSRGAPNKEIENVLRKSGSPRAQDEIGPRGIPSSFPTYGSDATIVGIAGKPRKLNFEPPAPLGPPVVVPSPVNPGDFGIRKPPLQDEDIQPIKGRTAEIEPVAEPVQEVDQGTSSGSVDPIVDSYEPNDR